MEKRFIRDNAGKMLMENGMLSEVLSRLPVKSLLPCKSVSKAWFSLISSPVFIKSHLNRVINTRAADETLVGHTCRLAEYSFYDVDSSFALFQLGSAHHVPTLEFPHCPNNSQGVDRNASIIGCDAGIVCVSVDASNDTTDDDNIFVEHANLYLWNPATKRSKLIPPHPLYGDDITRVSLGFGFDHIDHDLKVVRFLSSSVAPEVYSATRNSWRSIKHIPTDIPIYLFHACLHGFLFTFKINGMMAFDLNKEYKVEVWTLDDEACFGGSGEINASWTMMFNIDLSEPLDYVEGVVNSVEFLIVLQGYQAREGFDDEKASMDTLINEDDDYKDLFPLDP
ncbi:F-box/kelch-repeat protein At2g43270-like [Apium graveolens]|uniref:F-box/kelch-repeat protein At2g43270-like n=1 Tax=Apium graveolens TaxID=4045 RepID=UPI003D7B5415